jgi:hypothetical protein
MEVIGSSKAMLAFYQIVQPYVPEDKTLIFTPWASEIWMEY